MKITSLIITSLFFGLISSSCESTQKGDVASDTAIVATPTVTNGLGDSTTPLGLTSILFEESSFDFGKVDEGKKVEHIFKFTNTGANPLVLQDARASCGCTIPEYTKDTIAPGNQGQLKVIYDSAGKEGKIEKSVTVTANTEPKFTELKIQVFVFKKVDGPFNK